MIFNVKMIIPETISEMHMDSCLQYKIYVCIIADIMRCGAGLDRELARSTTVVIVFSVRET